MPAAPAQDQHDADRAVELMRRSKGWDFEKTDSVYGEPVPSFLAIHLGIPADARFSAGGRTVRYRLENA